MFGVEAAQGADDRRLRVGVLGDEVAARARQIEQPVEAEGGTDHGVLVVAEHGLPRAHQLAELAHPLDALVPVVPDQAEPPARTQHTSDLRDGHRRVDPVPRLRSDHQTRTGVGQREALTAAEPRLGLRHPLAEHLQHLRRRVDGDDLPAQVDQCSRQLAGAGT